MAPVLVFIDTPGESLHKAHLELLTIAGAVGEPVVAFNGELADAAAAALAEYGVTAIYQPTAADLDQYLVAPKAAYLARIAEQAAPAAVLLPNTFEGKEIAARLGIKLGSGVITDAVEVAPDLAATKSVLAGSYTVKARAQGTAIITVKPNTVEPRPAAAPTVPERISIETGSAGPAARITGRTEKPASGRPELTEASVVVAGGRGVDGNFGPIEELADALGGAVGASRAATDAGWIEHAAQIGQTGKTVSPQLYISAGISGAIQQKAGMQTAKVVVAVNKDEDAPVFEIADFGIVGDLFEVLPQAAAEIKRRRG